MKSAYNAATLIVLSAFVAGCSHKVKTMPPQAAQAPTPPVSQSAKNTPPPELPPAQLPKVGPAAPAKKTTESRPKRTIHHKPTRPESLSAEQVSAKDQTGPNPAPAAPPETEQASTASVGTDISPIGELSAAGESTNTPRRQEILDEILSTEKGLNEIKRPLSHEEQTTETQARTFLTKAKDALNQQDLDAAHSLATRAKVLLDELTKQ